MEFACGFVYIPPPLTQKDNQRHIANVIKRSALLPPANRIRPRSPPPPPPINCAKDKSLESHNSSSKIIEQLEKNKDVKRVNKPTPFYENAEFHRKREGSSCMIPQQNTQRTALLPPHLRPAAHSTHNQPLISNHITNKGATYELPKDDTNAHVGNSICNTVKGSEEDLKQKADAATSVPPLPPRPLFLRSTPEYLFVLPSSHSSPSSPRTSPSVSPLSSPSTVKEDGDSLPGNPNVVLVSLGKLLSEEKVQAIEGEPTSCSQCGSILDTSYDNVVTVCYFCQCPGLKSPPRKIESPQKAYSDKLFWLNPGEKPLCASDAMLIFCIDISGSMSITSQVSVGEQTFYRSRLEFVQEAVLQCVRRLSEQKPNIRVGLITFNFQVIMHGYENFTSRSLRDAELIEINYLKKAAASFSSPPPLSQTREYLERQVMELSASGTTALGPAALLAVAMASRHSGSKVIICTDGKANTELGNLEVEDHDARTPLSSTIFYQELGEYAANQGVTVSVLSIEGTDCRLDELGRLADRTGGKVVVASPNRLHPEFEQIIENRTIATHCTVTLLLPKSLRMRGEREAGHKGTREVGNADPDKEITFQFAANEQNTGAPAPGSKVSIQLQIRYKRKDGQTMLRVLTAQREVTEDSLQVLSSLSVAIIQLNSSQASAALAVRGRFLDAREEGELQMKLIERAIKHNRNAEDKETYEEWLKTMEPIYNNIHFTRRQSVTSDTQSLTDAGAALLYSMKHSNRKSMKHKHSF